MGSRGKSEVGVRARIGETNFYALRLRRGAEWNAARGRAVARRIGEQNRCFITRDQTLVGVGQRVGEGVHGLGVLDDTADEVEAAFRQAGIAIHRMFLFFVYWFSFRYLLSNWGSTASNPADGSVYVIGFNVPTIIRLLKAGEVRAGSAAAVPPKWWRRDAM